MSLAVAGGSGLQGPPARMWGGRLRPYIHPRKIRRRRADSDRGGARKRPAPVAVVRGHPEGKRRREPTRSKGPGICRKAGPGVNGRGTENPPLSRSVLPAVPATTTCVTGRRVRTPYALKNVFAPLWRRRRRGAKKRPYMRRLPMLKIAEITVQKLLKISSLQKHDFLPHIWTCFGAERRQFSAVYHAA